MQETNSPTRARPLRRLGAALAVAFLLAAHLTLVISWRGGLWNRWTFDAVATGARRGWDFYALYQAGHNTLRGDSIYASDPGEAVVPWRTPYRYLPLPALTLGVALNALPPRRALVLWMTCEELVLLACAWAAWRQGRAPGERWLLAAMWLWFTPLYDEFFLGQFSLVQAALIFVLLRQATRPVWGGALAWLASLLWKQNTALLAPLYVRLRRWRALALGATGVALGSAPYFLAQPGALRAFLGNLSAGMPGHQLGNLGARQALYSTLSALWPSLGAEGHLWVQRGWVAIILAAMLYLTLRPGALDALGLACLWMTSYLLIYHDVWEHHYLFAVPAYVCLYLRWRSPWLVVLWALTAIWTPYILIDPQGLAVYDAARRWLPIEPRWLDVAYHATKAAPTLVLWGWLAAQPARRRVSA